MHFLNSRALSAGYCLGFLIWLSACFSTFPSFHAPMDKLADRASQVTAKDGEVIRTFLSPDGYHALPADLAKTDPDYLRHLVEIEDKRFFQHDGVDPFALTRATWQWISTGDVISGASTITMQTVRLLNPNPRKLEYKVLEMFRAINLEKRYTKQEILEMYLSMIPFGGNVEGIRAASHAYFNKSPERLNLSEMALLIAIPQAPERLRPDRFPNRAREARNRIIKRLVATGHITQTAGREAMHDPMPTERMTLAQYAPHLTEDLDPVAEMTGDIRTTLNFGMQKSLEQLALRHVKTMPEKSGLGILVAEARTGAIKAYIGAPDYFDKQRLGANDMVTAIRSPGSTLKPFLYGLGFDARVIDPRSWMNDRGQVIDGYKPANFANHYMGRIQASDALRHSLNGPAVQLLSTYGPNRFLEHLSATGVNLTMPRPSDKPGLALILGGLGTSLMDLVSLFTSLSPGGKVKPLHAVEKDRRAGTRLLSDQAAFDLRQILSNGGEGKNNISWKTGTSYGFRDAWSIGTNGYYVVGVWTGRPDGTPSPGRFGRNSAAPVMFDIFGNLPDQNGFQEVWDPGVSTAARRPLPDRMKNFPIRPFNTSMSSTSLMVSHPQDGSELILEEGRTITLRAEGGKRPLKWLVDGKPVPSPKYRRDIGWQPQGSGFSKITVIDANGQIARASVRMMYP